LVEWLLLVDKRGDMCMQEKRKQLKGEGKKPRVRAKPTVITHTPASVAPTEIPEKTVLKKEKEVVKPPRLVAPIDQICEYLLKYGEKTCLQIARALNLDPSVVRVALNQLEMEGKIRRRRPLRLAPTQPRVVPARVPDRVRKITEERLKAARAMQQRIQKRQEEIARKRNQLLQQKTQSLMR